MPYHVVCKNSNAKENFNYDFRPSRIGWLISSCDNQYNEKELVACAFKMIKQPKIELKYFKINKLILHSFCIILNKNFIYYSYHYYYYQLFFELFFIVFTFIMSFITRQKGPYLWEIQKTIQVKISRGMLWLKIQINLVASTATTTYLLSVRMTRSDMFLR